MANGISYMWEQEKSQFWAVERKKRGAPSCSFLEICWSVAHKHLFSTPFIGYPALKLKVPKRTHQKCLRRELAYVRHQFIILWLHQNSEVRNGKWKREGCWHVLRCGWVIAQGESCRRPLALRAFWLPHSYSIYIYIRVGRYACVSS